MTNNKTLANRRNALLSTGPRTAAGRARVARNALAHGLYAVTVVPALGESPAALAELCLAVRQVLSPEGVLEERLCDRVALLLLRLDRVARFEAAVAQRAASGASEVPDPDTITGEGSTCASRRTRSRRPSFGWRTRGPGSRAGRRSGTRSGPRSRRWRPNPNQL